MRMRKTQRLLKWIIEDLNQCNIATAKMVGAEKNPEIADEINYANDKIIEAQKAVTEAMCVFAQIYAEQYDD